MPPLPKYIVLSRTKNTMVDRSGPNWAPLNLFWYFNVWWKKLITNNLKSMCQTLFVDDLNLTLLPFISNWSSKADCLDASNASMYQNVRILNLWHRGVLCSMTVHKCHSTLYYADCFRSSSKLILLLRSSGSCVCRFWYIFQQTIQLSTLVKIIQLIETSKEFSSNPNAFAELGANCFSISLLLQLYC